MILFGLLIDKMTFVKDCEGHCTTSNDWYIKHKDDSYQEFWGASLACFLLGAYTIIGSVYVYNTEGTVECCTAPKL